jgi:heat shock protein beta
MSPVVEKITSQGYDVLYMTEPLDEIMIESLRSFNEIDIVDGGKDSLNLGSDDEDATKKKEELNRENIDVINYLETILSEQVQKVTVSDLLRTSPAALVQGAYGMSPSMQRYMKAQAVSTGQDIGGLDSMNKVCMEINPKHPIIKDLRAMIETNKEGKETEDYAKLLFDVAGMTSGYDVEDMSSFAKRVMSLMSTGAVETEKEETVTEAVKEEETVVDAVKEKASEAEGDSSEAVTPEVVE